MKIIVLEEMGHRIQAERREEAMSALTVSEVAEKGERSVWRTW